MVAITGSATVTVRAVATTAMVGLDMALPAGANAIGTVSLNAALPAGTNKLGTIVPIIDTVSATTLTFHKFISLGTTNADLVKATVGVISQLLLSNTSASWKYFKLYNKAVLVFSTVLFFITKKYE